MGVPREGSPPPTPVAAAAVAADPQERADRATWGLSSAGLKGEGAPACAITPTPAAQMKLDPDPIYEAHTM